MIIKNQDSNRLMIYFFYDKKGIVDHYIPFFLNDVKKNVKDIFIVSNGKIEQKGRKILETYGEVWERENKGFDVWAYKTAMEKIGYEKLASYDEVILANSTIMGPVFPFEETFKKMDKEDVDFWGMTEFFKLQGDPFGFSPYGYLPDHIQSHWIACRKTLISSKEFQDYWTNLPMINTYQESVGKHESLFTKRFEKLGFKWTTSVEMESLREFSDYPLMMCPKKLMEEQRCPIFKKRSFFHGNQDDFLKDTAGEATPELLRYLKDSGRYDEDLIWETVLRGYHQQDLVNNMGLVYTLPSDIYSEKRFEETMKTNKVALIMHIYFDDLIEESFNYVSSMPKESDIYLTTDTIEKKKLIEEKFKELSCNKLEVRLVENRGRDVSALLVGVKDVIMNYDIACFVHDKKTAQLKPASIGASFGFKCFENTLGSKQYVANIIQKFADNKRLGLLSPPAPNHSFFYFTLGREWGPNFDVTKKLADNLGFDVPMDENHPPVAPLGTMFWFRPAALKVLYDKNWNYEDFPQEPNSLDGSILHAIERIYPFAVQQSGYYPAFVMTDRFSAIEYNNVRHYVRGFNRVLFDKDIVPLYPDLIRWLGMYLTGEGLIKGLIKKKIKRKIKAIVPTRYHERLKKAWENRRIK